MKFHPNTAIIVNYFLFTLLWFALHISASESKPTNIIEKSEHHIVPGTDLINEIKKQILSFEQKLQPFIDESINFIPVQNFSHNRLSLFNQIKKDIVLLQQKLPPVPNPLNLCNAINKNILSIIFNEFLTIQDILLLRGTCKDFQILLRSNPTCKDFQIYLHSNPHNMVTICKNVGSKEFNEVPLIWSDLKYFLNQSYATIFYKLEMFSIRNNEYAILTSQKKIIPWHNEQINYSKMLLDKTKGGILHDERYTLLCYDYTYPIHNKEKNAFADITQEGNVVTFGEDDFGGDSEGFQSQLKNVKMIVSTATAFTALLDSGNVVTWGFYQGSKIHHDIEIQLKHVKMIFSNDCAFVALLESGHVVAWGDCFFCGSDIPEEVQIQLKNIQTIASTDFAFAALSNDGGVYVWGDENSGGEISDEIQTQLKNIKSIFSNDDAFAALSNDGRVVAWGDIDCGGVIPPEIQTKLKNVKMIFSTGRAFAALLENGTVVAWGNGKDGGIIPHQTHNQLHQVKMLFSTERAFVALLENGNVFAWGNKKYGGKIPIEIQQKLKKNVKMIFQTKGYRFIALCNDGSTFNWGRTFNWN